MKEQQPIQELTIILKRSKEFQKLLKALKLNDNGYFTIKKNGLLIKVIDFVYYNGIIECFYKFEEDLELKDEDFSFCININKLIENLETEELKENVKLTFDLKNSTLTISNSEETYSYRKLINIQSSISVKKRAETQVVNLNSLKNSSYISSFRTPISAMLGLMKAYSKYSNLVNYTFFKVKDESRVRLLAKEKMMSNNFFEGINYSFSDIISHRQNFLATVYMNPEDYQRLFKLTEGISKQLLFRFIEESSCLVVTPHLQTKETKEEKEEKLDSYVIYLPIRESK